MGKGWRIACSILAGFFLLAMLLYGGLKTEAGQKLLVDAVSRLAPGVKIEGLSGDLPSNAHIDKLVLSDAKGPWLEIDRVRLAWHPFEALHGIWHIDRLNAARVAALRAPVSEDKQKSNSGAHLPDLSRYRLDRLQIDRIELSPEVTGGMAEVLAASGSLNGAEGGHLQLGVHTLEGVSTELTLSATLSDRFDGTLQLNEAPHGLLGHLLHADPAHALKADFSAAGDLAAWTAKGQLREDTAVLLDLDAVAKPAEEGTAYAVNWSGQFPAGLSRDLPQLKPLGQTHRGQANFTIDAEGDIDLSDAALILEGLSANAHGRYSGEDGLVGLDLTAAAASLKPFSPLIGASLSGPLSSHLEIKGRMEALAASLDLTSPGIGIGENALRNVAVRLHAIADADQWRARGRGPLASDGEVQFAYLGKPVKLVYGGSLEQDDTLAVKRLSLDSAYGTVTGEGTFGLSGGEVSAKLEAGGLMLGALSPDSGITGDALVKLEASGTVSEMTLSADATAEKLAGLPGGLTELTGGKAHLTASALLHPGKDADLRKAQLEAGAIAADASGDYDFTRDTMNAKLSGTLRRQGYAPVDIALEGGMTPQLYQLRSLSAEAPGILLSGKAAADRQTALADGSATLAASDLSALSPLLGEKITGSADAALTLKPAQNRQSASLTGKLNNVTAGDMALGHADILASAADALAMTGIKANIKARGLKDGATTIATLDAAAHSVSEKDGESLLATVNAAGTAAGAPLSVKTAGAYKRRKDAGIADLTALSGSYGGQAIALGKPVEMRFGGQGFRLSPLALHYGGGALEAEGAILKGKADLAARLIHLPLAALMPGNAEPPQGDISAQLAVKGSARAPDMTLHADIDAAAPSPGLPPATLSADATLSGGQARMKASLKVDQGQGQAEAHVPVTFSLSPFAFDIAPAAALAGQANASLPLAAFNPWLRPGGQEVAGQLNGSLALGGTKASPDVKGKVQLSGGSYDGIDSGICLHHIDAALEGDDTHMQLTRLAAHDDQGGTLQGSGDLTLSGAGKLAATARLSELRLFCRGPATGNIAGDIQANGSLADLLVQGQLKLGPLTINLPDGPGTKIPEVKVTRLGQPVRKPDAQNGLGHTVRLDLAVDAPEQVVVRGRGLDAEFKGKLKVAGTAAQPEITGLLETVRGRFELLDRQLTLNTARITFGGPIPPAPFLDISASTTVNATTITVAISGSAEKPDLTLTSSPVLPQDELLAQLLFGRTLSSISPFQAVQLAQSAATLAGKGGGPGILDKARDALGVDTLSVDQGATTGSTTVGAGKYITPKVYVGVAQGTTPESRAVTTQIEVAPSVTAGTTTDSEGRTGANLNWRWDY